MPMGSGRNKMLKRMFLILAFTLVYNARTVGHYNQNKPPTHK